MVLGSLPPPLVNTSLQAEDRDRQGSNTAGARPFWIKGWIQRGAHSTPKSRSALFYQRCFLKDAVLRDGRSAKCLKFHGEMRGINTRGSSVTAAFIIEHCTRGESFENLVSWQTQKEDLKAHNSFSRRRATKTATACVLLGCLARRGEGSRHQGTLEATCPNKRPLADGAFFAIYKLRL